MSRTSHESRVTSQNRNQWHSVPIVVAILTPNGIRTWILVVFLVLADWWASWQLTYRLLHPCSIMIYLVKRHDERVSIYAESSHRARSRVATTVHLSASLSLRCTSCFGISRDTSHRIGIHVTFAAPSNPRTPACSVFEAFVRVVHHSPTENKRLAVFLTNQTNRRLTEKRKFQ